jgi:heme/copper-type cytochrome/quinol oxidase subunit 1
MNWEAIGAIGEILGALAVILTLIYLAVQVRYTKDLVRNQNHQTSYEQWANTLAPQATSPQVADLLVKGKKSYLELDEGEKPNALVSSLLG